MQESNIKLLFTGDLYINKVVDSKSLFEKDFQDIVNEHTLVSCNLEAPIINEHVKPIPKAGPHLSHNNYVFKIVKELGFNVINISNNHIYDYGEKGLQETFNMFKNLLTVGAGFDFESAYSLKRVEINNIEIGFLSYCEAEFGALADDTWNRPGYAWVNHPSVNQAIREAKEVVDFLFVQVHAGIELEELPLPEWRRRYKELIDFGADLIIGHHPHVPQGWERYKGKYIYYSLGNLFFDKENEHPLWNYSYAVSVTIDASRLIKTEVVPLEKKGDKVLVNNSEIFLNYLHTLSERIMSPNYSKEINELSVRLWEKRYKQYYEGTQDDLLLLLHNIRIESHRWVVERALSCIVEQDFCKSSNVYKEKWLRYLTRYNKPISKVLEKIGVKNIVIFGTKELAINLYFDIKKSNLDVSAFIDNNCGVKVIEGIQVHKEKWLKNNTIIDAVIVTVEGHHDKEIISNIKSVVLDNTRVLSWKDVVSLAEEYI